MKGLGLFGPAGGHQVAGESAGSILKLRDVHLGRPVSLASVENGQRFGQRGDSCAVVAFAATSVNELPTVVAQP